MELARAMMQTSVPIPSHCPISAAFLMPVPHEFLSAPLEYIAAEHARQRCVCAYLRHMAADGTAARADVEAVVMFMTTDQSQHHDDEDVDLFPALRRRASQEDALEPILDRLARDHVAIDRLAETIVTLLVRELESHGSHASTIKIDEACSAAMSAYATSLLQHLSIENSITLVLARKRLTSRDLAGISWSMTARRAAGARV